ncbi:MAG TPA: hypothetical protein VK866_07505 [Acidimicrobiales bacterium]|nr:hypothetical protein [Acidimicrobiales bacterium]
MEHMELAESPQLGGEVVLIFFAVIFVLALVLVGVPVALSVAAYRAGRRHDRPLSSTVAVALAAGWGVASVLAALVVPVLIVATPVGVAYAVGRHRAGRDPAPPFRPPPLSPPPPPPGAASG